MRGCQRPTAARPQANPTLHWTGPAERSLSFESVVGAGPAIQRWSAIRQEQLHVPKVCVQFQPDRVTADDSRVRQAFRKSLPDARVVVGDDNGRYENMIFQAGSPEEAMSRIRAVLESLEVGRAARASCIVTCQGEHGWDDYLLLHHFDRSVRLDAPAARPAE